MTKPDSTPSHVPFSERGGIERTVFISLRDAVQNARPFPYPVRPENEERSLFAESLPRLIPYDSSIRIEDDGTPWVSFVRGSQTRVKDEKPHDFVVRWENFSDVDAAYRGVKFHVADAYSRNGTQRQQRLGVVRLSNELLLRFQQGAMSDQEWDSLNADALEELFKLKYLTSYDPEKRKTAKQILNATKKDKSGKKNPPRSRMMISQERDDIVEDIVADEVIEAKNRVRAVEIDLKRNLERIHLSSFAESAEQVVAESMGTGMFGGDVMEFRRNMHALISPRFTIQLKPYRQIAAEIFFQLYAKGTKEERDRLIVYVGEQRAAEILNEFSPFRSLLDKEKKDLVATFEQRIKHVLRQSDRRLSMSATDWIFDHDKED